MVRGIIIFKYRRKIRHSTTLESNRVEMEPRGLTKMPFKKFMIVIALSNIGVAVIFSGLGAAALSAQSSLIGFVGAAILPAILYWIYKRFRA